LTTSALSWRITTGYGRTWLGKPVLSIRLVEPLQLTSAPKQVQRFCHLSLDDPRSVHHLGMLCQLPFAALIGD